MYQDSPRLLDKVDRCGSPSGLPVKLTVGTNEVRHVGDMDSNFERSIRQRGNGKRIVKITGTSGVDSEDAGLAQISPFGYLVVWDLPSGPPDRRSGVDIALCFFRQERFKAPQNSLREISVIHTCTREG